jgi:hypothetical protein
MKLGVVVGWLVTGATLSYAAQPTWNFSQPATIEEKIAVKAGAEEWNATVQFPLFVPGCATPTGEEKKSDEAKAPCPGNPVRAFQGTPLRCGLDRSPEPGSGRIADFAIVGTQDVKLRCGYEKTGEPSIIVVKLGFDGPCCSLTKFSLVNSLSTTPSSVSILPTQSLPRLKSWMDSLIAGSFGAAFLAAAIGWALAGKGPLTQIGKAEFKFESWATNTALAGGILSLVLRFVPAGFRSSDDYSFLGVIFGLIGGAAPILYNLTTRSVAGEMKGYTGVFALSAMLTAAAAMGQVLLSGRILDEILSTETSFTSWTLAGVVVLTAVALLWHTISSVRDTIIDQTEPMVGNRNLERTLPGGKLQHAFPAL